MNNQSINQNPATNRSLYEVRVESKLCSGEGKTKLSLERKDGAFETGSGKTSLGLGRLSRFLGDGRALVRGENLIRGSLHFPSAWMMIGFIPGPQGG